MTSSRSTVFQSAVIMLVVAIGAVAQTAKVTHVSDGDSFIIATGERVRMIGVNAPELADHFGEESKQHLAGLIRGKEVLLERDPLNDDRDRYGRLLRYVSVDGIDINRQMIAGGYAYAFLRYRFDPKKREAYRDAEASAKRARVGIWALNGDGNSLPPSQPATPTPPVNSNTVDVPPQQPRRCSALVGLACLLTFVLLIRPVLRALRS